MTDNNIGGPTQAFRILQKIWKFHPKGYVFLPWIPADKAADRDQRRQAWHEAVFAVDDRVGIKGHIEQHWDDELYFTPNVFSEAERRSEHVLPSWVLYADLDPVHPVDDIDTSKRPSIAWQTSQDRYACVWVMDEPRTGATDHGRENHRLSRHVGADPSGWDTTQVLRVPGSKNNKPGKGHRGFMVTSSPREMSWDGLLDGVRSVPAVAGVSSDGVADVSNVDRLLVLSRIEDLLPRWVMARLDADSDGGRDRSEVLWSIERELADAGCSVPEIVAAVRPTVWNKYAGRRDELKRLTSEAIKAGGGDDPEDFWNTPQLRAIRATAIAFSRSPWALLVTVLVRVSCAIPPNIVTPADITGSPGSLNIQAALLGASGDGKDNIVDIAKRLVPLSDRVCQNINPGSGEAFAIPLQMKDDGKGGLVADYESVLFTQTEVDEIEKRMKSKESRYMSQLLHIGTGGPIGRDTVSNGRSRVEKHRYRYGVVIGVQPEKFGVFIENAGAGFPQRFIFAYAREAGMAKRQRQRKWPESLGVEEGELTAFPTLMDQDRSWDELTQLRVPDFVIDQFDDDDTAYETRGRYEGHVMYNTLKVAAALMWLRGERQEISPDDWEKACVVMSKSKQARGRALATYNRAQGYGQVKRARDRMRAEAHAKDDIESERLSTAVDRCKKKYLDKKAGQVVLPSFFKAALTKGLRDYADDAIRELVRQGWLEKVGERRHPRNGSIAPELRGPRE
ncbi:hypothetical protein M1C59_02765 [Gordonia terrae]|uniref:hypothetical protein n=1 Tax=Gordonia terrae TaxID=2055 RepID=UPI00200B1935|nr:hypothetical protein [Gordonia terrae]UPW09796.1 hypothetical protein M1C59_02765 [Gordonia terrae]